MCVRMCSCVCMCVHVACVRVYVPKVKKHPSVQQTILLLHWSPLLPQHPQQERGVGKEAGLTRPSSASVALSSSSVLPVERRLKGKASELRAPRMKARTSDNLSRGLNTPVSDMVEGCMHEGEWGGDV